MKTMPSMGKGFLTLRRLEDVQSEIDYTARARHDAWLGRDDAVALDKLLTSLYEEKRRSLAKLELMRRSPV